MSLHIKSVEELQELAEAFNLRVANLDDLQDLLMIVNQGDVPSDVCREALAAREHRLEQQRQMQHAERMRALELGHDPHTTEMQASVAKANTEAAGWVAVLVPLGLAGIAVGATAVAKGALASSTLFLAAIAIIWGTMALIGITSLVFSQMLLHQRVIPGTAPDAKPQGKEQPAHELKTAIKEPEMELTSNAYYN